MVKGEPGKLESGEVRERQRQQGAQRHANSTEADKERACPRAVLVRHKYRNVPPVHRPRRPCSQQYASS